MKDQALINIAVTVLVLAFLLSRQLAVRPLRERSMIGLVLLVVGLVEAGQFVSAHSLDAGDLALLVLSLAIGCALAVVRALWTIRLWVQDGRTMRQGNALTALLWVVSLGQHLAVDKVVLAGAGSATILLYFGVVLVVQREVLVLRARRSGVLSDAP
ncbi:hypothetical protein [Labedaea rhizosphaerae]|uniref:DUF1453 domain-containing protein n=1 Tax=Labedaea rhizosphaerae TaxID=598644 RepID=A0A4R6SCJ2_LABRH|nr:hypothetical protein [Labedaea rhizosphaerae]TDP96675.1 hypothetical protein EV186_104663 [Labedaea rhizosphaerae]